MRSLLPHEAIKAYRERALTPDKPVIRGTSANPDTFFQCREAINPYYDAAYDHVVEAMTAFAQKPDDTINRLAIMAPKMPNT